MHRNFRLILGGVAILATTFGEAEAQYYYPYGVGSGGYGFGGFSGTTPQGNIARGLGNFAAGEGIYNYDTAVAESVDTNTVMRWNQYLYNSELEARRRYNQSHARRLNLDNARYQERQARIRENPSKDDIDSGDALNVILDQMTDPKVMHGSSFRLANATVQSGAIRDIPFRDETDAITLSLDELTDPKNWPLPLRAESFRPEREEYQKAVDDALAEDKDGGSLKPETITRVRNSVARLYQKVNAAIPKGNPDHNQAINYLKGLAAMSRMLERPNVEAVLAELEKIQNTTTGNLIGFMHAYNLRFAPANTPKRRAIYRDLLPIMVESRDKVLGQSNDPKANADTPPPPPVENPTAIFNGLDPKHLHPANDTTPGTTKPSPGTDPKLINPSPGIVNP